jgi:hypothetical protein
MTSVDSEGKIASEKFDSSQMEEDFLYYESRCVVVMILISGM